MRLAVVAPVRAVDQVHLVLPAMITCVFVQNLLFDCHSLPLVGEEVLEVDLELGRGHHGVHGEAGLGDLLDVVAGAVGHGDGVVASAVSQAQGDSVQKPVVGLATCCKSR